MATQRFLTPANIASGTVTAFVKYGDALQRSYSATAPSFVDAVAPDNLDGNQGWVPCGVASGTTAQRPAPWTCRGQFYLDTTLGFAVCSDGAAWRNPISGVLV